MEKTGDLFQSRAQTLVNTVNCFGVMGKGIALTFKKRYPDMFQDYARRCKAGQVKPGEPYIYRQPTAIPPWILNFPTKRHWRSPSRISDIIAGLEHLEAHFREWGIQSLAVPALGCENGGLKWGTVRELLNSHLQRLDIDFVEIYAPYKPPTSPPGQSELELGSP